VPERGGERRHAGQQALREDPLHLLERERQAFGARQALSDPHERDEQQDLQRVDQVIRHLHGGNVQAQAERDRQAQHRRGPDDGEDADHDSDGDAPREEPRRRPLLEQRQDRVEHHAPHHARPRGRVLPVPDVRRRHRSSIAHEAPRSGRMAARE
jgi:hypothetical protein